jgi:CO/xanthine dehydrogenase Mo-binding subunit
MDGCSIGIVSDIKLICEPPANAGHRIASRAVWRRSSTVPIETFGVAAQWDPGQQVLDVWASIQMPKYPDQTARALRLPGNAVRVHYDVDVGGSYGVKRGIEHTVLVGYLARRLGMPVRFIEDRLENMCGGDMQGPDRIFDVEAAFDRDGTIRALKIRALDDVGAYAGRSPLTTFGQKGSGEAGYLGAPGPAVANAVNDALAPLDASIETLPMTHDALWHTITAANAGKRR